MNNRVDHQIHQPVYSLLRLHDIANIVVSAVVLFPAQLLATTLTLYSWLKSTGISRVVLGVTKLDSDDPVTCTDGEIVTKYRSAASLAFHCSEIC